VKRIPLTRGYETLVDDEDYEDLAACKWYADVTPRGYVYAKRTVRANGRRYGVKMHRAILGANDGKHVDHANRDTLDNRRSNLRFATRSENTANSAKRSNNTSGYKGVTWHVQRGKWRAQIAKGDARISLGLFTDAAAAARAYRLAAEALFGEFARAE
jgi:hypothetical protein